MEDIDLICIDDGTGNHPEPTFEENGSLEEGLSGKEKITTEPRRYSGRVTYDGGVRNRGSNE